MQTNHLASAIKGLYKHKQIDGFLMAREYIFLKEDGKKCLLQRFFNETSMTLTDVEFDLIELNINGEVVQKRKFEYHDLSILPNEWFSIPEGIVVSSDCVDFKIARCSIWANRYLYRVKRGKIQVYYDRRKGKNATKKSAAGKPGLTVFPCAPNFGVLYGATTAIAVVSALAICLYLLFVRR